MQEKRDVDWVIAALKRRYNVDTDEKLADALGISRKTVSSWRSRGAVPTTVMAQAILSQVSIFEPLLTDAGIDKEQLKTLTLAVFLFLRDRYRDLPHHDSRHDALLFWAETYPAIEGKIERILLDMSLGQKAIFHLLQEIIESIERDQLLTANETLDWPDGR